MKIKVIRSWRRQKTASARLSNGVLIVRLPALMSFAETKKIIDRFKKTFERKGQIRQKQLNNRELKKRADCLNQKYFNGKLKYKAILWSDKQNSLHGSCSIKNQTIRISSKLARLPKWVLDATIMHELSHLVINGHGKKFWQIANRYPLMERARGYLMALARNK